MSNILENNKIGVCGVLCMEGEVWPLYFRPETGSVVYYDEINNTDMCVGELSIDNAKTGINHNAVAQNVLSCVYGKGALGIIFTEKDVIVINSMTSADRRPYQSMSIPSDNIIGIMLDTEDEYID